MSLYKITYKDGSTNQIIGTEEFCKEVTQDGGSYEVVNPPNPSQAVSYTHLTLPTIYSV